MRVTWVVFVALLVVGAVLGGPAVGQEASKLIAPPAINVPSGGVVVTEINVSDDDVLGIIKQAIPVALKAATPFLGMAVGPGSGQNARASAGEMVGALVPDLMEALKSLKGLRVIIVQYPGAKPSGKRFLEEFDKGVGKLGGFSKVLGDVAFFPGAAGIYAQPGNAGYIGFTYDPRGGVAYAIRTVGFVDLPKLLQLVEKVIPMFTGGGPSAPAAAAPSEPAKAEGIGIDETAD